MGCSERLLNLLRIDAKPHCLGCRSRKFNEYETLAAGRAMIVVPAFEAGTEHLADVTARGAYILVVLSAA